jgi:hypothetical protein
MDKSLNAAQPGQPTAPALRIDTHHPGHFAMLLRWIICRPGRPQGRKGRNTYFDIDSPANGDSTEAGYALPDFYTPAYDNSQYYAYPVIYPGCHGHGKSLTQPYIQPHVDRDVASAGHGYFNQSSYGYSQPGAHKYSAAADCNIYADAERHANSIRHTGSDQW